MAVRPTAVSSKINRSLLEALEPRQLLASVNVMDYGAVPNDGVDDSHAVQRAINFSAYGDTITFPAGQIQIGSMIRLKGDRTYTAGARGATLKFNVPRGTYGLAIQGDAQNTTITGLKLDGAGIDMGAGRRYTNTRITNNEFTGENGWSGTAAISLRIVNDGTVIENNRFHDFRQWGFILFHVNNSSISGNGFCRIFQGGQIVGPRDNVTVSNNIGQHLVRMGLEIQRSGNSIANGLLVSNNTFYDWVTPNNGSFGLSIMPEGGRNVRVVNNYIAATRIGPWGNLEGQGQRFGIGIEAGFDTGEVSGNIIGGPFAHYVTSSSHNMLVTNNKFYGQPVWGSAIARWPGIHGYGTFQDVNNFRDSDFNNIPAQTAPTPCDPSWIGGGSAPPVGNPNPTPPPPRPTPVTGPSNLGGTPVGSNRVDLTWRDNTNNELGFKLERSFQGDSGPFVQIALIAPNLTRFLDSGLPANANVWYRIRAYTPSGNTSYSNVIQVKTKPPGGGFGGAPVLSSYTSGNSALVGPLPTPSGTSPFSDLLI